MSVNQPAAWLIAYDIACRRRLARAFKLLKSVGQPVQFSVFAVQASPAEMAKLLARLAVLVDKREDDVRAYRLSSTGWRASLGDPMLPDGILLK